MSYSVAHHLLLLLLLVPVVRLDVERGEHVEEESRVDGEQAADAFREGAIGLELNLRGVCENDHKLHLEVENVVAR